ncbi:putative phospholipid-transporting ATPase IA isoform X2 [Convolutriloba macropyga]|uniref:putative phospholipid-transporting ATPase IA isoform X2 n=1 Tax=Convolutriloba macropyga TaxID=536237 RepID=UPI003F51DA2C
MDKLTEWCYSVARKYRNFQREHNLLDASYDIELGPVRKKKNSQGEEMGSVCTKETVRTSRDFYVGEENSPKVVDQSMNFCSNRIRTTKYSFYSFIPKFFLEQFRKAANCFFLLVSILQIIPGVSPTGRFTTLIPLSIILFLTALKEIYEDIMRLVQDRDVNQRKVQVLTKERSDSIDDYKLAWKVTHWDCLKVGDIIQIRTENEASAELRGSSLTPDIPADLLILATSEVDTGTCTITTKNLDGETNLKSKSAVGYSHRLLIEQLPTDSRVSDEETGQTSSIDIEASEVARKLDGLSNGRFLINCECPNKNMEVFKGQMQDLATASIHSGDSALATSSLIGNGNAPQNDVGMVPLAGGETVTLSIENLLLRECRLENTEWVVGCVVYTGPEAKISLNNKPPPLKQSSLEKITNVQIYFIFAIMLTIAMVCFAGYLIYEHLKADDIAGYVPDKEYTAVVESEVATVALVYATFFILFNNLVPISLMFTVEMVKIVQAYFINSDPQMVFNLIKARARTSNLNDELGRIKHVFSDKTGTLTQNKMEFKKCFVNETAFDTDDGDKASCDLNKTSVKKNYMDDNNMGGLHEFILMMASCNSVTPNEKANAGFISSSPDEHALVLGAKSLGYTLKSRGTNGSLVELPDGNVAKLKEIEVVPFDSNRKRMSLIFKDVSNGPDGGDYKIFTKGADMTMLDKLNPQSLAIYNKRALPEVNEYSKEGLRVLVFASRKLTPDEVTNLDTIKGKLSDPTTKAEEMFVLERDYEDAVKQLESDLDLVGVSAVEDKLQDGVPECIASLRAADIVVWMLTGDKLETAYEIAHSCQLFSSDSSRFTVHKLEARDGDTKEDILQEMARISSDVHSHKPTPGSDGPPEHGLIFEGSILKTLEFSPKNEDMMKRLYYFTRNFKSVAACRLEPLQKAELVEMTQTLAKGEITLAIGDGANDVPMIQAAHVGIGIQGEEGLQAVLASDYSIGQFRFLKRLLFIHGAFSYQRVSKTILYSFYKNITLYFINFWYQFACGFSGQSVFDKFTLSMYNIMFTSLPLLSLGLLDRPVSEEKMLKNVFLYRTSQYSLKFNAKVFWMWCVNALAHSLCVFLVCLAATGGDTVLQDAKATGILSFGEVIYTAVIIVVTLKLILVTNTFFHATVGLAVVFGFLSWTVWFLTSSYIVTLDETYGFFQNLTPSPYFWLTVILATIVALYRDIAYKCLKIHFYPSLEDCVRRGISPRHCRRFLGGSKHDPPLNFTAIEQQNGFDATPNTVSTNNSHLGSDEEEMAFTKRFNSPSSHHSNQHQNNRQLPPMARRPLPPQQQQPKL